VDDEVSRVINEAYARAMETLTTHRDLLDRLAQALLDRETLSREDIAILEQGQALPPRQEPPTAPAPVTAAPPVTTSEPRRIPPIGGTPEPTPA